MIVTMPGLYTIAVVAVYLGTFAVIAKALKWIFYDPAAVTVQTHLLRSKLRLRELEVAIVEDELARRGRQLGVASPHTQRRYASRGKPWGHR